jgi:hypothetical protein
MSKNIPRSAQALPIAVRLRLNPCHCGQSEAAIRNPPHPRTMLSNPHSVPYGTVGDDERLPFSTNIPSHTGRLVMVRQGIAGCACLERVSASRRPVRDEMLVENRMLPSPCPSRMGRNVKFRWPVGVRGDCGSPLRSVRNDRGLAKRAKIISINIVIIKN